MTTTMRPDVALLAQRRAAVSRHPTQQGIDRVEVSTGPRGAVALTIRFLPGTGAAADKAQRPGGIGAANVEIGIADDRGGSRPQGFLRVIGVANPTDAPDAVIVNLVSTDIRVPSEGAAQFVIGLIDVPTIDPFFATATFSTSPVVGADVPPTGARATPADPPASWPVDYQARDFASIRGVLLDRLNQLMPQWQDADETDLLHTIVDVLAYAGDHLSYFQDAVATEAHLGTARRRISVRRHARLLDYVLHEGCNARTWVQVSLSPGPPVVLPAGTRLLTRSSRSVGAGSAASAGSGPSVTLDDDAVEADIADGAEVFETMQETRLNPGLAELELYDWGLDGYALPAGACVAELRGAAAALSEGMILILHPATGTAADADGLPPVAVVRVTGIRAMTDALAADPPGLPLTRVTWHSDDALRLALPVAAPPGGRPALASGTVVLADHGRTIGTETVPGPAPNAAARFRTRLFRTNLTWRQEYPVDAAGRSASDLLRQQPRQASPALRVTEVPAGTGEKGDRAGEPISWRPVPDLLDSDREAADLVVEMEDDGTAQLRFGDGIQGRAVGVGSRLMVSYRVGNGEAGNVGRGAIAAIARPVVMAIPSVPSVGPSTAGPSTAGTAEQSELGRVDAFSRITAVTNPLPATGGTQPEPVETVRLIAPRAFNEQQRCVVEEDFVAVAQRHPKVRRATATYRWSGSWLTALVVVDRVDGLPVDEALVAELRNWFEPFRLAGADLIIRGPVAVFVDVVLRAAVVAGHRADLVERELRAAFGSSLDTAGLPQFFHPSRFTIGDPLYLSQLVARAANVPGVGWADVSRMQRRGQPSAGELDRGVLAVGPGEVLRVLDGDLAFVVSSGDQ